MAVPRKKVVLWIAIAITLLLIGNSLVATRRLGTIPGQAYRWVCRESGAELSYDPSVFGSARLSPPGAPAAGCRWELVEPEPLSPFLPWNWLAIAVDRPVPNPEDIINREGLAGK